MPLLVSTQNESHHILQCAVITGCERRRPIQISSTCTCCFVTSQIALRLCGSLDRCLHVSYIRMAGPPHRPSHRTSLAGTTCRPTRMAGCGTLTAELIVFGLQTRMLGSTKIARECRILRQRPKRSAVRTHNRMYHHCRVQQTTANRTRRANSANQPRVVPVDYVAASQYSDSDAGNANFALANQFSNLGMSQGSRNYYMFQSPCL